MKSAEGVRRVCGVRAAGVAAALAAGDLPDMLGMNGPLLALFHVAQRRLAATHLDAGIR